MPKITCPKCGTPRSINLGSAFPILDDMLGEVKRTPGFSAPEFLGRYPGVGATALNQRLEDLRRLGLVRRERDGRAWRYYPV